MKKRISISLLILFLFMPKLCASNLNINSEKYILYNITDNELLMEKDSKVETSIASLTKIMTAIVAIENIEDLDEEIIITRDMISGIDSDVSVVGFKSNDKVTYRDLLYGIIMVSGADAVNSIAIKVGSSIDGFVEMMNSKAKEIKMQNTHFENPVGLYGEKHYSSAYDLYLLLNYVLKNEKFKEIFDAEKYTTTNDIKLKSTRLNYTNYGVDMSNITGTKTGYINAAGYCLASSATFNNADFILITLNAFDKSNGNPSINDTVHIYDYYKNNYNYHEILNVTDEVYTLKAKFSKEDEYIIHGNKSIEKYLPNDFNKEDIEYEYKGTEIVSFLTIKNTKLGVLTLKYDDKELYSFDVLYDGSLTINILSFIVEYKYFIIAAVLMIIIIIYSLKNRKKGKHKRRD